MTVAHCITNDAFELRSCTLRGVHRSTCDGWARDRRVLPIWDPVAHTTRREHRTVILSPSLDLPEGVECQGCMPRPAITGGRVCEIHSRKIVDGVRQLPDMITHLWSLNGSGPRVDDGGRPEGFGPAWLIPESRAVANDLIRAALALGIAVGTTTPDLGEPYLHPYVSILTGYRTDTTTTLAAIIARDLAEWLIAAEGNLWCRSAPALRAVEFAQIAGTAYRRFPTEDAPHRIPVLRCRRCERLTLEWHPPLYYLDDDAIKCGSCGAVEDRSLYEHDVAVILAARGRRSR